MAQQPSPPPCALSRSIVQIESKERVGPGLQLYQVTPRAGQRVGVSHCFSTLSPRGKRQQCSNAPSWEGKADRRRKSGTEGVNKARWSPEKKQGYFLFSCGRTQVRKYNRNCPSGEGENVVCIKRPRSDTNGRGHLTPRPVQSQ